MAGTSQVKPGHDAAEAVPGHIDGVFGAPAALPGG
jgi:hypothetical protein